MSIFQDCLKLVLDHEGGFINHPSDPGGMTNLGVTRNSWARWVGRIPSEAEMRALTVFDVAPLYEQEYWNKLRCGQMPPALAYCVFDFGVNSGNKRAAQFLQRLVGAKDDGNIGPKTLAAVQQYAAAKGLLALIENYCDARRDFLRGLATFKTFGKGWLRRVNEVEDKAKEMI